MSTDTLREQVVTTAAPALYPVVLPRPKLRRVGERDVPFIDLDDGSYAHVGNLVCDLTTLEGRQDAAEYASYLAARSGRSARFGVAIHDGAPVEGETPSECGIYLHDLGNGLSIHALQGALASTGFIAPEFFKGHQAEMYALFLKFAQGQLGIPTTGVHELLNG